ncbi:MAG: hypothetical protein R3D34_04800 [Nitratireductor sp.]
MGKGYIRAELTSSPISGSSAISSQPHHAGLPGLDAMWQLIGFYPRLARRARLQGLALSTGEVKLKGMVTPSVKLVEYGIDFKRDAGTARAGYC